MAPRMAVHLGVRRPGPFGGEIHTSLCGRLNRASSDGMNVADDPREVTCKFCLKRLARRTEARPQA